MDESFLFSAYVNSSTPKPSTSSNFTDPRFSFVTTGPVGSPEVGYFGRLAGLFPHGGETKVLLTTAGAESVENAIKIARQASGRSAVICYSGAFHGRTMLGMTLTSKVGDKINCGPFAPEV